MTPLLRLAGAKALPPYVENAFRVLTYTGTGASRSLSAMALSAQEGMAAITMRRDSPTGGVVSDTVTGTSNGYYLGSTSARQNFGSPTAWSDGAYTVSSAAEMNTNGGTYVSWQFRRRARFFDVVSFSGASGSNLRIPHSLGVAPGMIMLHPVSSSTAFLVYHVGAGISSYGNLSSTAVFTDSAGAWGTALPTSTDFGVNLTQLGLSTSGNYIAYLFADDRSKRGLIRAGVLGTTGAGSGTLNLGWAPEMLLIKPFGIGSNWECFDQTRGWATGTQRVLPWNGASSESNDNSNIVLPTSTGVQITGGWTNTNIMYLAIRKGPMKP